jgi:thiamine pyrophosphokinase
MTARTALIFANGEMKRPEEIRRMAMGAERIIAADGGLSHIQSLGLIPNLLIGDLDSVTVEQILWAREVGAEVSQFPISKDETDLELALLAASNMGCQKLIIVGALGGRLDQTLSNIFLLHLPDLADLDARIDDGKEEVILVRNSVHLTGKPGEIVSLLPLSPIVRGITTIGLQYPLQDESMVFYRSRGVSNIMVAETASVEVLSGILICIHERREDSL